MLSRETWLFGFLVVMLGVWAKAMRPLFRQLTKRAPATKTLARRFSGMLFSSRTAEKPENEKDILVRLFSFPIFSSAYVDIDFLLWFESC